MIRKSIILLFLFVLVLTAACTFKREPAVPPEMTQKYEQLTQEGQTLIFERRHREAMERLDAAGAIIPGRPEWLYEKSRALFAMDRYGESLQACRQALERDPEFLQALGFSWGARLEAEGATDATKAAVRQEIESLLTRSETIGALLTAYDGYQWLKDEPAEQQLILELANRAEDADADERGEIARSLFEQIVQARDDGEKAIKTQLMQAYVDRFPENEFVEEVTVWLLENNPPADEAIDPLAAGTTDRRRKTGIARWLIEQEKRPELAIRLLNESLAAARQTKGESPAEITDPLLLDRHEKEIDRIHSLLGRAWFLAGDNGKAAAALERVAARDRPWSAVYHYLGLIARSGNDPALAISRFRQALAIEPRDDTEAALRDMLREQYRYTGKASRYFIGQSNGIDFADVTEKVGLKGIAAARVAWGDYDADGFPDLLFDGCRLFRNTGKTCFKEVTATAGLEAAKGANGGVWGDYDNDGDIDIFITSRAGNRLFQNSGKGTFRDVTVLAFGAIDARPTEAAAWGDLDNDGFLDLYAANYERSGVMRAIGTHDQLYRNNGEGSFTDISRAAASSRTRPCAAGGSPGPTSMATVARRSWSPTTASIRISSG